MSPSEVFGIVVRVFGLGLLVSALWYLADGIAIGSGFVNEHRFDVRAFFVTGGLFLLLSLYFLRGAPYLVRFCYPLSRDSG